MFYIDVVAFENDVCILLCCVVMLLYLLQTDCNALYALCDATRAQLLQNHLHPPLHEYSFDVIIVGAYALRFFSSLHSETL